MDEHRKENGNLERSRARGTYFGPNLAWSRIHRANAFGNVTPCLASFSSYRHSECNAKITPVAPPLQHTKTPHVISSGIVVRRWQITYYQRMRTEDASLEEPNDAC